MNNQSNLKNQAINIKTSSLKDKQLPEIKVNGEVIDEQELAEELQYHQAENFEQVVQKAAQALVVKKLLLTRVQKQGINIDEQDQEKAIQNYLDSVIKTSPVSDETCKIYFDNNQDKFKTQPLIEVDHILISAHPNDLAARDEAKQIAYQLIEKIKAQPDIFPHLAKQYSACPSKEMGGNLGQISKGQTLLEFEKQITRLALGLSDKPIESRYGYHVVRITNKIEGRPLDFSMVADKIKTYLNHRQMRLEIQSFIHNLMENAQITGFKPILVEENIHF